MLQDKIKLGLKGFNLGWFSILSPKRVHCVVDYPTIKEEREFDHPTHRKFLAHWSTVKKIIKLFPIIDSLQHQDVENFNY